MNFGPGKGRSVPALLAVSILTIVGFVSNVSPAAAAPVLWGGFGSNDLGQGTITFSVNNGRAKLTSLQAIMACTDTNNGRESDRAYSISNGPTDTLNLNRFNFNFNRSSGGRRGHVRLSGILRSNGHGNAHLNLTATARGDLGGVIERCQASLTYSMNRGRVS